MRDSEGLAQELASVVRELMARDRRAGFESHLRQKMEDLGYYDGEDYVIDRIRSDRMSRPVVKMQQRMSMFELKELADDLKPDFNAVVKGDTLVFMDVPQLFQARDRRANFEKHLDEKMEELGYSQTYDFMTWQGRPAIYFTGLRPIRKSEIEDLVAKLRPGFNAVVQGNRLVFMPVQ